MMVMSMCDVHAYAERLIAFQGRWHMTIYDAYGFLSVQQLHPTYNMFRDSLLRVSSVLPIPYIRMSLRTGEIEYHELVPLTAISSMYAPHESAIRCEPQGDGWFHDPWVE